MNEPDVLTVGSCKVDHRPPRHGWADGHYMCKCFTCQSGFIGDKRATSCADCAYGDYVAPSPEPIKYCQMTRELKLKLALAKLRPDDIEITDLCNFRWKRGEYAGEMLRESEWVYVVYSLLNGDAIIESYWQGTAITILERIGVDWDVPC